MIRVDRTVFPLVAVLLTTGPALSDVSEDIGLDALLERLGPDAMPTGAGVRRWCSVPVE